ncbi:MAG TPA: DegQ family serine endoprotease [Candidatus Tectomicrobia bacterium]|nr:DegQ family serine endoprotease [Candidatus Tectomicrobia bacterium]
MRILSRRRAWVPTVAAAALALVALLPGLGDTKNATLWTETPVTTSKTTTSPDWTAIAKAVKPAVVNVSVSKKLVSDPRVGAPERGPGRPGPFGERDPFEEFFRRFGPDRPSRPIRASGSGFVISPDGYIITNNHVVDGADEVRVKFADGRELDAKVVGRDPKTDLALIKVDATGLPVVPLGDSDELQVAEPVMAIGNPFGLAQTVTTGIVSATGRVIGAGPYDDFIQTDASINPGNSGGPLINARGQAIGVNTAIFSRTGGSVGIGFAIPINLAKTVTTQLAERGHVVRGWLGVTIQPVTPELARSFSLGEPKGALVSSVAEDSPAKKAGLQAGDVIVGYDGKRVERSDELPRIVAETPVGRTVSIEVIRNGKRQTLSATIARLQDEEVVASAATEPSRATLGVAVAPLTPELARELGVKSERGVVVREVRDGSPADEAGLRPGDVIKEVNRKPVTSPEDLRKAVEEHGKGKPVLLLVERRGATIFVTVTV